jgi:RsiW-degrading membrane proteinase PrsW (M82 family)
MNSSSKPASAMDIAYLIYTILGTLLSMMMSGILWIISLLNYLYVDEASVGPGVLGALAFTLLTVSGIPAIYTGARVALGKDNRHLSPPSPFGYLPIFLFPIAFIVGYLAYAKDVFTVLLGPLAQLIAAVAGVSFAIQIARQKGAILTQRRFWGQFVTGLWLVPIFALVMEILVLIPALLVFSFGALTSENGRQLLKLLSDPVTPSAPMLQQTFDHILLEPWFILTILAYFAFLVPLIEEALKTMVVWPLLFRKISSAQALMGGIIGGSGYALFEAIFLAQDGTSWLPVMVGRTGATMMHAFATGIACWGLAEGFVQKRWLRALLGYLIAVSFHGIWNTNAVIVAFSDTAVNQEGAVPAILKVFHDGGPYYIVILSMIAVFGIPWITRKLASQSDDSTVSSPDETGPIVLRDPRRM